MTKAIVVFFIFGLLVSCGKSNSHSSSSTDKSFEEIGQFKESRIFQTRVKMVDFEAEEQTKIQEAAALIKKVVMSPEFKQEILDHEYNGQKTFANNRGFTNLQIYQRILQGAEKLTPHKDYEMDVTLVAYEADNITVGYTMPNTVKIWMNRKFFSRNDAVEVTTNLMHEWLHKLGFDHAVTPTIERPYSVPYAVGYLMRRLARDLD